MHVIFKIKIPGSFSSFSSGNDQNTHKKYTLEHFTTGNKKFSIPSGLVRHQIFITHDIMSFIQNVCLEEQTLYSAIMFKTH